MGGAIVQTLLQSRQLQKVTTCNWAASPVATDSDPHYYDFIARPLTQHDASRCTFGVCTGLQDCVARCNQYNQCVGFQYCPGSKSICANIRCWLRTSKTYHGKY